MATEKETKRSGKAAEDTLQAAGKASSDAVGRAGQATADMADRSSSRSAEAVERSFKAAAVSAESMTKSATAVMDASRTDVEAVTESQRKAIETLGSTGASVFSGLTEMQREIAGFVTGRIRQDLETQQELLRCRTLNDVVEVQGRFFRTAVEQYSDQAKKLMQHSRTMLEHSVEHRDH